MASSPRYCVIRHAIADAAVLCAPKDCATGAGGLWILLVTVQVLRSFRVGTFPLFESGAF